MFYPAKLVHRINHGVNFRPGHLVENVPTITAVGHQTGIAQYHQVLRDVRLAQAEHRFHPPLDIVDGAARIVDPIIDGVNSGQHVWGQFLKDYRPTDW